MANGALHMRTLRLKRVKNGLCTRCGKPTHNKICTTCADYLKEHNREKRAEKHTLIRKLRKWDVESKIIYSWMLKNNITTAQLARLVGVNQRTVQRWLFESKNPTNANAEKLEALMELI